MAEKKDGIAEILATGRFPGTHIRGGTKGNHGNIHIDPKFASPCPRYISDGMSAAQSEEVDKQLVEEKRKLAHQTRMARRGTKRADDEIQHTGAIPYALHAAVRKETGNNNIWEEEGSTIRKKYGLDFPT